MGERIQANLENWLLTAPDANPGMIEMFRIRDRKPKPELVPWAGEFVGKYLISAIQAMRMTDDPRLPILLKRVVAELVATQADDGYLGPFRKEERLLGNWDLWGHYHCMMALLMWHDATGETDARDCAIRAADLICKTYLDSNRRVLDMGSHEMNMAVIHVLGRLYRDTGNERYMQMMRKIEKEMEEAGDYFRLGLRGVDFYKMPRPRWESLHDIQGILEFYRITGNEDYRKGFENIWRSIDRFDVHNTGGFSTFEQAIGNPYTPGAIETCCTIAWMALTIDMLQLTGDSKVADALELSTWNHILGAQHPSGRWWTYDTPMDGVRRASAHSIVFQSREGTPELNCCSVNAPRGLGMLSEWGFMAEGDAIIINYYGPVELDATFGDNFKVRITEETNYPVDEHVVVRIAPEEPSTFAVRFRIPNWSVNTAVRVNGVASPKVERGNYFEIRKEWSTGDRVELDFDFTVHSLIGDEECLGKISPYRGPLLLAFDSHFNTYDTHDVPPIDMMNLVPSKADTPIGQFVPMILLQFQGTDGRPVVLCDFATAGAYGTHYLSWLPAIHVPPPSVILKQPADHETVASGPIRFEWSGSRRDTGRVYTLTISKDPSMENPVVEIDGIRQPVRFVNYDFVPGRNYYWRIMSYVSAEALPLRTESYSFTVDVSLENPLREFADNPALVEFREDGLIAASRLDGNGAPEYGCLVETRNVSSAKDRSGKEGGAVRFSGDGMLRYKVPYFPVDNYTFLAWVCPEAAPKGRLGQVFSAWAKGGDDPLRVVLENQQIFARIEGFTGANSKGAPINLGEWIHVAVVKEGAKLSLYINGKRFDTTGAPAYLPTTAEDFALGANPHHTGSEFLTGCMDDFAFYCKTFTDTEIAAVYADQKKRN